MKKRIRMLVAHALPRVVAGCTFYLLALSTPAWASSTQTASFMRFPNRSETSITFVARGDLWTVPLRGGAATRLTHDPGGVYFPRLSPDGRWIAFTARRGGTSDVYVMPAAGGPERRLTFIASQATSDATSSSGRWIRPGSCFCPRRDPLVQDLQGLRGAGDRWPATAAAACQSAWAPPRPRATRPCRRSAPTAPLAQRAPCWQPSGVKSDGGGDVDAVRTRQPGQQELPGACQHAGAEQRNHMPPGRRARVLPPQAGRCRNLPSPYVGPTPATRSGPRHPGRCRPP